MVNTGRGAYVVVAVVGLAIGLLLRVGFSIAALIGVACGIVAQQIADERWLRQRGRGGPARDASERCDGE